MKIATRTIIWAVLLFLPTSLLHAQKLGEGQLVAAEQEFIDGCDANVKLISTKLSESAGFQLNTNLRSLEYLDDFVTRVLAGEDKEKLGSLPSVIGCFLGQVIISEIGGKWMKSTEFGYAVELKGGTMAFPFNTSYDHLVNGPEDSILGFFNAFKAISENGLKTD